MESVLDKIRQSREGEANNTHENETVINGCHVKLRFAAFGDSKILPAVQSILISSHLDAALAGGECV